MAKCEWDMLSDIFQEAIDKNGMSKEDVKNMIIKCRNEVRNEKMPISKAIVPCLSAEAGKILMADIESTGIRQDVLDRSKMILERLLKEKRNK